VVVNWGDVPTWLATAGASVAAIYAGRAYRIERNRDRQAEESASRAQASKVAVWTETFHTVDGSDLIGTDQFMLRNASEAPVYEVVVFSYRRVSEEEVWTPEAQFHWGTLAPGGEPESYAAHWSPTVSWTYTVQFMDAEGVVWHRTREGRLEEGAHPGADRFERQLLDVDRLP
jgi:hypothetical protein